MIEYNEKFYINTKKFITPLVQLLYNPKVYDKDLIPDTNFILAGNHTSMLDVPLLIVSVDSPIKFMAKKELFENKITNFIFSKMGAFPVDREGNTLSAIKNSIKILRNGGNLGIFPEGTRNKTNELLPFKGGVELLSIKTNTVIVPFGISGTYKKNGITLRFGKSVNLRELGIDKSESTEYIREKVMELI